MIQSVSVYGRLRQRYRGTFSRDAVGDTGKHGFQSIMLRRLKELSVDNTSVLNYSYYARFIHGTRMTQIKRIFTDFF